MASRKGLAYRKLQQIVAGEEEISLDTPTTNKRSYMICGIIIAVVVIIVIAVAVAVTLVAVLSKKSTEECSDLACMVKSRLDTSADPCEDFYQFACGGFDKSASKNYIVYSTFSQTAKSVQNDIKDLLGNFSSEGVAALQKVKDLYDSCMDTSAINSRGVQPLRDIIAMTGGWSLVDVPNESQYPSWDINGPQFQKEKLLGSPAFFHIGVGPDPENSSKYILELMQSGLSWPTPQFYDDSDLGDYFRNALKNTIISMLQKLNPGGRYESVAQDIVSFEEELARIHVSLTDLSDVEQSTNIMTIANLSSNYPYYDWAGLIHAAGIDFDNSIERVNVLTPSYFSALSDTLDGANSSLENYAKWHFTRAFMPALDDESLTAFNLLKERATGKPANQDRYQSCIDIVEQVLPMALARSYAEHVFPDGVRENVTGMIEELKVALKERIDTRDWLDDYSRQQAKEKVDALTQWVGYPDEIFNDAFLNGLYDQYPISRSDYFNNYLQYTNISIMNNFAILHQPVNRTLFLTQAGTAPTQVNAFYYPPFNRIAILMGIMNAPFFQLGWPNYYLFGALGGAIGHEMVHGFDNAGRHYDPEGNYHPWWSNSSILNYENLQECFVNQYSGYGKFGRYVNGNQTLGENIADNGGIKASFQAYKNFVTAFGNGTEPSLSGLEDYTPEQLFFVAWAQDWCTYYASKGSSSFIVSTWIDVHSPGPFRVTGPLVNNPDFAQAFHCSAGSAMNPTNKCLLW